MAGETEETEFKCKEKVLHTSVDECVSECERGKMYTCMCV